MRLIMFKDDLVLSKELSNEGQVKSSRLTFLNNNETITSINHYNSRV